MPRTCIWRASALLAALLLVALSARADRPSHLVLVLGTDAGPPPVGFVEALSIQLAGLSSVRTGPELRGSLPDKLAAIRQPLSEAGASAGVWVERVPTTEGESTSEFLVHVATRREDKVLVQVVRLPGPDSPETDRALALKVREVLESVLRAPAPSLERAVKAEPPEVDRAPPSPAVVPAKERGLVAGLLLDTAVLGASGGNGTARPELGALAGAGIRLRGSGSQLEVLARAGATSGYRTRDAGRVVETNELLAQAAVRALLSSSWLGAGVHLFAGARFIRAEGQAPDGRSGSATRTVPMLGCGPEVRVLFGPLAVRGAVSAELALKRQRFAVQGETVSDVGSLRGLGELGLAFSFE